MLDIGIVEYHIFMLLRYDPKELFRFAWAEVIRKKWVARVTVDLKINVGLCYRRHLNKILANPWNWDK